MSLARYHLFLSYARADDRAPVNARGEGWVTAFERELRERHQRYSGRDLRPFFDQKAIEPGRDWRRELGAGLRSSRLFLSFLSPNYITSENCLWEWEEYLRREHSAARGDDGLTPIFFVTPRDLSFRDDQRLADWLQAMQVRYPWFQFSPLDLGIEHEERARRFAADLHRRNRKAILELQPWFDRGPQILEQLDAAERSEGLRGGGRDPAGDLRTLAQRLDALDLLIAQRLDRIALADLAPGNVPKSHEHFVGRHRDLSHLHSLMVEGGPQSGGRGMGGRSMIAATHSPGGLGKTALARQYCHAYAEFYAAGGTWEIACEGVTTLGAALLKLTDDASFLRLGAEVGLPLALTPAQKEDFGLTATAVIDHLRAVTLKRVTTLREALKRSPDRHTREADLPEIHEPRVLLLLDNVDQPELLSAVEVARLPGEEWLEVIVTTRLDPTRFGIGDRWHTPLEIEPLPDSDALNLIRDFQPDHRFAVADEETAASEIVQALGGYTLAVELVAAYLGDRARQGYTVRRFCEKLATEGLLWVDSLTEKPEVHGAVRHSEAKDLAERKRQNRIETLIRWSMERISEPAKTALRFASLLMPDSIPTPWLNYLIGQRHPRVREAEADDSTSWPVIWRELHGLCLLHSAQPPEVDDRHVPRIPGLVRLHRLVAAHVAASDPDKEQTWSNIEWLVEDMGGGIEEGLRRGRDKEFHEQRSGILAQLEHLIGSKRLGACPRRPAPILLRVAQSVARLEGEHGSLARALSSTSKILKALEETQEYEPTSSQAARDVAVSLIVLGSLLTARGHLGDSENALKAYLRSHVIREHLFAKSGKFGKEAEDFGVSLTGLGDYFSVRGNPGDTELALMYYEQSLEIAECLLAEHPMVTEVSRDVACSLERLGDLLKSRGHTGDVEKALAYFHRCLEISEGLLADHPESAQASRDASVIFDQMGDLLFKRGEHGDTERALTFIQRSLELKERLWADVPESIQTSRDLSWSLQLQGDLIRTRGHPGDWSRAFASYQRSLEILRRLAEDNPESAQSARDISVSLNRLGALLKARGQPGDAEHALGFFQQSLKICRCLSANNPGSAEATRGVSRQLINVGDLLSTRGQPGDREETLSVYHQCLEISERLIATNSESKEDAWNLSVILDRLGDFHRRRGWPGDAEEVLIFYERSLAIREYLLAKGPESAETAQALAQISDKLSDFLSARGQPADAEKALGFYQRSLEVRERLLTSNPESAEAQRDVLVALERLAAAEGGREGRASVALELQCRSLELALALRQRSPQAYYFQRTAATSFVQTYHRAMAVGNDDLARQCLEGCWGVLNPLAEAGIELDPPMRQLHGQLKPMFSPST